MHPDVKKVLFSEEQIINRCEELGQQITKDFANNAHEMLFVGTLKGSIPFMAELIKHINLDIKIDFISASSYQGEESTGKLVIKHAIDGSVLDKDIVIIEDIVDTGLTIKELKAYLKERGAHDVKVVSLLNKQGRRVCDVQADYIGFEIENEFVIGYGLDYNQKYRNLPYVGVIKEECC